MASAQGVAPSNGGFIADKLTSMGSAVKGLGTLSGVFLPTVQNITGVLLFLRLPWITGQAGILLSLAIVACSVGTTIPTALSMSAIATNGRIPAGGPYYVVSRNLGAPFGAAIGFLFYLGTSLAATMYVLGAVEAFQVGFGLTNMFPMDRELIAIGVMFVLALIVYVGVEWVSRTMYLFLGIVVCSIILGIGGLAAYASGASFGTVDEVDLSTSGPLWTSTFTPDPATGITPSFQSLIAIFFPSVTGIMAGSNRSGLLADPAQSIPIGTLAAIAITTMLYIITIFMFGSLVDVMTLKVNKLVFAAVAWPVREVVTIGIIASSVGAGLQCLTGAPQLLATMLADDVLPFVAASQNLARHITSCCGCCGSNAAAAEGDAAAASAPNSDAVTAHPDVDEQFEDRFGTTDEAEVLRVQQRRLASARDVDAAENADEGEDVRTAAAAAAAASAPGSPRRGRAATDDEEAPADPAKDTSDPTRGVAGLRELAITWVLASLPCLAGNLDMITPIQTEFFLMLYATVNLACFLQTYYYTPSFRPTWPVHWVVPAFGVVACLVLMFLVQWWQALLAIAIAAGLYQWVKRGEQDDVWGSWGSSLASVTFGQASTALLALRDVSTTASTWRPHLLLLLSTADDGEPSRPEVLALAGQLKKGRGITMATSVRRGLLISLLNRTDEDRRRRGDKAKDRRSAYEVVVSDPQRHLQARMASAGVDGFAQLVVAPQEFDALQTAVQTTGLSALRPNSVMVGWPRRWREDPIRGRAFVTLCKAVLRMRKSLIAVKMDEGAMTLSDVQSGTIDLYWMGSDSGLILLLPFLLTRHRVWRRCKLRLFAVDPALSGKTAELQRYLAAMRIPATVQVVPVEASIIDESLQGRTLTQDVAEQLQAELQAARERGDLVGSDTAPLSGEGAGSSDTRRELAEKGAAASSMTMVMGQPGAGRRSAMSPVRASVFDVFGKPNPADGDDADGAASPGAGAAAAAGVGSGTPAGARSSGVKLSMDGSESPVRAMAAVAREADVDDDDAEHPEDMDADDRAEDGAAHHAGDDDDAGAGHDHDHDDEDDEDDDGAARSPAPQHGSPARTGVTAAEVALAGEQPAGPSAFVKSALRMNELIREHSSGAALVVASMMLTRDKDAEEFLQYTEAFCAGIPRAVLVRGTGQEVLSAVG
ncbi:hypothetical protein FNF31_05202 [Cafeteria roenbergensis]|uniref:Amino acid permease/ SLC12A domain-containing protein n=1 Tax=Cafeteria roenbergensis TaxID=33653 RepID=A0A5A8DGH6_CAFRO|nr:hypothetical protein FNF31_05202 [Cafeteria roenbergensis]KAA0163724.1 hypothetical protein FNF28_04115 [Cafeteria roenbergensis]